MTELLADRTVSNAVSNIIQRSERQPDVEVLERTFVDTGVMLQLDNRNSQILYGRRGTGKSHVFRVLGAQYERAEGHTHAYLDVRMLGSAQMMTDTSRPIAQRSITVFRDIISVVHDRLLEHATDPDLEPPGNALEAVAVLGDSITTVARDIRTRTVTKNVTETEAHKAQAAGTVGTSGAYLEARLSTGDDVARQFGETFIEALRETVVFSDVARALNEALEALGLNMLLLVDEWTAIPTDVQPFVADFVKRTLLPCHRVTLKIASLEYRSRFSVPLEANNLIGFEVGGDIAANIDLDDYYVYERTPDRVIEAFLELLYRHVVAELPEGYLEGEHGITTGISFRARLFTEPATFIEAVRAGEGVVRDFLGIVGSAFFRGQRAGRPKIDINSVEEAARDWFETDKSTNLSEEQQVVLHRIISEVIGDRQARSFLLERTAAAHPMIQSLFDLRLLHLMRRGYSDKQNPGLRYNIYALDYGTYVDLKRTKSQPEIEMVEVPEETAERLVPFDDKRSIRRIILDPAILEPATGRAS